MVLVLVFFLVVCSCSRRIPPLELRSEGAVTCDLCKAFTTLIEIGFAANVTETVLLHEASLLCSRLLPHFSQAMCDGIIQERYGKVVYAIAKKLDGKLPNVCEFIGACHNDSTTEGLYPKRKAAHRSLSGSNNPVKYFVQMSDIHFDQYYQEGSSQACNFTLCW